MNIIYLLLPVLISANLDYKHGSKRKPPTVLVTIDIEASVEDSFEYIVPVDLSHIFKRYKRLPGIDSTSNKQLWYTPGMQRTVYFEDGNTAEETLLTVNPHSDFSYKIDNFTSPLRKLAKRIEGNWKLTELEGDRTHIEWTYKIIPKNFLTRLMINAFIKNDVEGLLNNALAILKNDLENSK